MLTNAWKRAAPPAAKLTLRRSMRTHEYARTLHVLAMDSPAHAALPAAAVHALPTYVLRFSTSSSNGDDDDDSAKRASIWAVAETLRAADITKADREPVVQAIQALAITAQSTDAREKQALEIIQSNALESLLGFLTDERLEDFHIPTYLSLIKLTSESLIVQELLRLDGAGVVAKYLVHPDPRLQAAACLTLGNLALDPVSVANVATEDVLEPLFQVLSSPHEAIQRTAVTTIANVAGTSRGRDQICSIDRVFALCALLSADKTDALRSAVAFALGNVLSGHDSAAQDALRESGALPELILMVSPAQSDEMCSSAAWAIHHGVHLNHENQSMVADAGGFGLLFQHVFADSETLQTNALLALESTIAGHDDNVQSCRANTDAVLLLQSLKDDADEDLNHNAKRALNALLEQIG